MDARTIHSLKTIALEIGQNEAKAAHTDSAEKATALRHENEGLRRALNIFFAVDDDARALTQQLADIVKQEAELTLRGLQS